MSAVLAMLNFKYNSQMKYIKEGKYCDCEEDSGVIL